MSASFWGNLLLATVVFGFALAFINRSKIKTIRHFMAQRLRRKTLPKLKAILPIVAASLTAQETDLFPLFRLRADLETLCSKADVLFEVEHLALAQFLTELSFVVAKFEAGNATTDQIDDLVLLGQRAINELSEFGR